MRRVVFLSLAGLLVASAALAEDFWVKKEFMQWTDEEVRKVMTESPWAKEITVPAPSGMRGGQRPQPTEESDTGGGGGGRGRGGRGGGGGGGTTTQLLSLHMSWRSALPLRKALVRSRLGAEAAIPQEAQQMINNSPTEYVLIVSGVPTPLAQSLHVDLLKKSTIQFGKQPPVEPKGVDMQAHGQSADVVFVFPKMQTVTAGEDKDVEVLLKLDATELKKKFNLKDMVYNGKLEL